MTTSTMTSDKQSFRIDFERFCASAAVEMALSPQPKDYASGKSSENTVNDFAGSEYENPVAWYRKYKKDNCRLTKDVLFDNVEMKYVTLAQYGCNQPEYIKWKLFGYNIVICYEYINKRKFDQALNIISDIEQLLESIESNDSFLNSIRIAIDHVLFSMKAHVSKLCCLKADSETQLFVMPNDMNNVNKAGLFGIRALFFYEYDTHYTQISIDSTLKAITYNEAEPEWYFLLARILRNLAKTTGNWVSCEEEFQVSKTAVEIGNKIHHKLHLSSIYLRMCKNNNLDESTKNEHLDAGLKILNEAMDTTNDLVLLKYSLLSLSKVTPSKNVNSLEILEKLVTKLEKSDNGYIHGIIGYYYLFNKKNYGKALFHLKQSYDAKSFGGSFDYIYTLYKMNPSAAPVEQILVGMLKTFPHPIHQEKILSQIISYLLVTKDDLIGALKYIPILLSLKNITCIYSLQNHKMKFGRSLKGNKNVLDVLSEKLIAASKDQALPIDYKNIITEVLQILKSYKLYAASILMKYEVPIVKKKDSNSVNIPIGKNLIAKWSNNNKQNILCSMKNKDEGNWRALKVASDSRSDIFSGYYQKRISNNTLEFKSPFNTIT